MMRNSISIPSRFIFVWKNEENRVRFKCPIFKLVHMASAPKKCAVKTKMLNCHLDDSLLLRVIACG